MSILFLLLLAAYALHAVAANLRARDTAPRKGSHPLDYVLQTPLFVVACYLAVQDGALNRDLVSPVSIGAGLVAGHVIFLLSLSAVHRGLRDALGHFLDFPALGRFLTESPQLIFRFLAVSIAEEVIYRAAAQPLLAAQWGRPVLAILVVAAVFCVTHGHFFRNAFWDSVEFAAFSLLLGILYHWTHSLSLVVVIHTMRNLEIVFIEFLDKVRELGNEAQALAAIESAYGHPSSEHS